MLGKSARQNVVSLLSNYAINGHEKLELMSARQRTGATSTFVCNASCIQGHCSEDAVVSDRVQGTIEVVGLVVFTFAELSLLEV